MERFYKREYLPGYCGYAPQRFNTQGISIGKFNKQYVLGEPTIGIGEIPEHKLYSNPPSPLLQLDSLKFSNQSRKAVNWIAGPTDRTFPQYIPGSLIRL